MIVQKVEQNRFCEKPKKKTKIRVELYFFDKTGVPAKYQKVLFATTVRIPFTGQPVSSLVIADVSLVEIRKCAHTYALQRNGRKWTKHYTLQ